MNLQKLKIIKSDERGIIYDCDKLNFIFRNKGTISADHLHKDYEILYLVNGEIELTINNKMQIVKAPIKIEIPENTYHKIVALSDIEMVEDRENE